MVVLRCPSCCSVNMRCDNENERIVCNDCTTVHDPYDMNFHFSDAELSPGLNYIDYLALEKQRERS